MLARENLDPRFRGDDYGLDPRLRGDDPGLDPRLRGDDPGLDPRFRGDDGLTRQFLFPAPCFLFPFHLPRPTP